MQKKLIILVLTIVMIATLAIGCAEKQEPAKETSTTEATTTDVATTQAQTTDESEDTGVPGES